MDASSLYPLRFEPIYRYRPWGGRRLTRFLSTPLPGDGPIGESWLLSDRDDYPSVIAEGPLKGQTLNHLLKQAPALFLGTLRGRFSRFPVLLKCLDVTERLSVQVHPPDACDLIPQGETGKAEAWVVLEAGPAARVFAGWTSGTTADTVRQAIAGGTLADTLAGFTPSPGQAIFIRAGTVHSLRDAVVFEIQQNSDVTFRLYDWDRIDSMTGQRRPLQVEQAMACIDLEHGATVPLTPVVEEVQPLLREKLVQCEYFTVTRITGQHPFIAGAEGVPRVLVCLEGRAVVECADREYAFCKGDVLLLPAALGECFCRPASVVVVLEVSL